MRLRTMAAEWQERRRRQRELRPDRAPWQAGFAIRRDWPDGGHDFSAFTWTGEGLDRQMDSDRRFWRRGPVRPSRYSVVSISWRDFDLHTRHRPLCRALDCPAAPS